LELPDDRGDDEQPAATRHTAAKTGINWNLDTAKRISGQRPSASVPRSVGGQSSGPADYQRRERQRQTKNDEAQPSSEAAREEFFPGV
jgi:hypothetical protein